jgi:hypothetical protein
MLIWETIIYRDIIVLVLYAGKKVNYYIILSRSVKNNDIKFLQSQDPPSHSDISYRFVHEEPNGGMISVYKYFITCNVMTKLVNSMNNFQELFLSDYVVQLDRGEVISYKINGIGLLVLFLP